MVSIKVQWHYHHCTATEQFCEGVVMEFNIRALRNDECRAEFTHTLHKIAALRFHCGIKQLRFSKAIQRSADKASSSFIYWCTSLNLLCLISLLLGASGARSCVTFTGVLFNKRDSDFLLKICSFDQSVFKGYFIGKKMKVEGYSVAGGLKRATENHPTTLHMTSSIQEF